MKLSHLLSGITEIETDIEITGLRLDSRKVKRGDVFFALNGALQHGIRYTGQAAENGATAVVYDPCGIDDKDRINVNVNVMAIAIRNLSRHLGEIAARFYDYPSKRIDVIGITGTNGKTTCSQLLAQALPDCGVVGTLGWGLRGRLTDTCNTTPDAFAIQEILDTLAENGTQTVVMEVSSHGLEQGRVNAVEFKGAVFTNLTRDHLDYHGNMQAYLKAKLSLFTNPALEFAVINLDDASSKEVLKVLTEKVKCWGFSVDQRRIEGIECLIADKVLHHANGIEFDVHWGRQSLRATTPIIGAFNLQNVMTVLCVLLAMDWSFDKAVAQLARLTPVIGRMEKYGGHGKPTVIVDYAHTPDALEKVLLAAKAEGRLWVVFGCGGDRDKGKRPEMGRIAETYADHVVVTDDNPRTEASETIIKDILAGCASNKINVINDRHVAITTAIYQAGPEDLVVIAGKGHENYQEINGVKTPFSDQAIAREALAAWGSVS
ncbi:UDP-N-acetylmuramoyl-L-alanyl-D-glutamate--2,6-diaminopimelate ligase [Methylomonas sp. MgM2]